MRNYLPANVAEPMSGDISVPKMSFIKKVKAIKEFTIKHTNISNTNA